MSSTTPDLSTPIDNPSAEEINKSAMITGLFVALVLTTVYWYPPITTRLLPSDLVWRNLVQQGADWFFCLALIGIVIFWEKRPLSSLGFRKLSAQNIAAGLGLGGFFMVGFVIWAKVIMPMLPAETVGGGAAGTTTGEFPPHFFYWFGPLALITASFCEEVIYRGYAMERLLALTNRPWVAVALPHIAFVLYHWKDGWQKMLGLSVLALLFSFYYIKTRDLTVTIVGHAFIDTIALVGHAAESLKAGG